ncbi:hypothetical protein F4810DRAFT_710258 [Camillea tinctor]|nr:hypothetical protein F4810DRAFT_710258 [Camillea tinctor]
MGSARKPALPPPQPLPTAPRHTSRSPPITAILKRTPLSNRSNLDLTLWDYKDSSKGRPSSHGSIYDAGRVSTSDVTRSPYQTATTTTPTIVAAAEVRPVTPPPPVRAAIDLDSESPLSKLETPFLYGHGTELAPILEQRSISTLRTGSFSTSDVSSLMHGAPPRISRRKTFNEHADDQDSDSGASTSSSNDSSPQAPLLKHQHQHQHRLRRRQSFSLADLPLAYRPANPCPPPLRSRPRLSAPVYARPTTVEVSLAQPLYPARSPPGQGRSPVPTPFRGRGSPASHAFVRRRGGARLRREQEEQPEQEQRQKGAARAAWWLCCCGLGRDGIWE